MLMPPLLQTANGYGMSPSALSGSFSGVRGDLGYDQQYSIMPFIYAAHTLSSSLQYIPTTRTLSRSLMRGMVRIRWSVLAGVLDFWKCLRRDNALCDPFPIKLTRCARLKSHVHAKSSSRPLRRIHAYKPRSRVHTQAKSVLRSLNSSQTNIQ
jgi:hypothetical protein